MIDIEICVEQLQTALVADKLGVNRIELCTALDLGGLTPSAGLIEACSSLCTLDVYVMIRPREGGFCYSDDEVSIMKKDIQLAKTHGASGVVFGCLNEKMQLDTIKTQVLLDEAKSHGLGTTFHRAIDFCQNADEAIEKLINWGFDRILSSGKAKTAIEGIEQLRKWKLSVENKIEIMAASGVSAKNAKEFMVANMDALHFTARKKTAKHHTDNMGYEYELDRQKIIDVIQSINNRS